MVVVDNVMPGGPCSANGIVCLMPACFLVNRWVEKEYLLVEKECQKSPK
jgi:hypothetical protein